MVSPSGTISLASEHAAATLAACPSFQTLVGADDAAAARASIYLEQLTDPAGRDYTAAELAALRPFALVRAEEDEPLRRQIQGVGGGANYADSGRVGIELQTAYDEGATAADNRLTFTNLLGALLGELGALAFTPGYLNVTEIAVETWGRIAPEYAATYGDHFGAFLVLSWRG